MSGEVNITNVRKEDKEFIRIVTGLAPRAAASGKTARTGGTNNLITVVNI